MRPQSIKLFDLFYLGSMFLGALGFIASYPSVKAEFARQSAESGVTVPPEVSIAGYVIGALIGLALWYFVSRRRSTIAKWILVALFLLSLVNVGGYFVGPTPLYEIYGLLSLIANAIAIALLFRADAIRWLNEKPADDVVEPTATGTPHDEA
ncbi:hypothetical protein [Alteriqipengyuania lutimaris]|uniref:DUF2127 domain-containing protein n=1 Tax=Alteriqipengyuania lutimaris TaxID=1538146 RepID=A0A395LJF7_9SPHN|nr:hypothetical protein [Alteriqipengyuania lutimaris]MBB3034266.1 hypothetical protein [Alteriqipengyuania lutimaris]RDS76825.1 hypothetical protein DL238_03835 [Alteriqipengyuania lutimaris]